MSRTLNSKKSVGVFMTFLSGIRGGADVTAMWLIQALCGQYDVTLVTTSQFDLSFFNNFAGTELDRTDFNTRRIRLIPMPQAFPMSAIQEPLFQRTARSWAGEFDLCLSAMNPLDLGVPAAHFVSDFEWLLELDRNSTPSNATIQGKKALTLRRAYLALAAWIQDPSGRDVLRDDILVSNSQWVAAALRAKGIESCAIYPPVPWVHQEKAWESRRNDFVWFGRIAPQKKVEQAIEIVARLRNAGMDCGLEIAGTAVDKEYLRFLSNLARRAGEWVMLRGPVYGADKATYLTQFRYALHTRADEPFGITLVELMKAGCIPFAPNSCGSAEILNHPALLFATEDEAVGKICSLIEDAEQTQIIRSFLFDRAKLFSTDTFCQSARALAAGILDGQSSECADLTSLINSTSGRIGTYGT